MRLIDADLLLREMQSEKAVALDSAPSTEKELLEAEWAHFEQEVIEAPAIDIDGLRKIIMRKTK